jgi:hypothetical protein
MINISKKKETAGKMITSRFSYRLIESISEVYTGIIVTRFTSLIISSVA